MKSYCTQNNGDCESCSLASYNRDCDGNQVLQAFNVRLLPSTIKKISELTKYQKRTVQGTIETIVGEAYNNISK
jgi:hypothetical protein